MKARINTKENKYLDNRYAFTPLLDVSDDEIDDKDKDAHRLIEGTEVKSRNNQMRRNSMSDNEPEIFSKETVDNLKWIEENITTSLVDS